jgi:hypothetical protein
MKIKHFETKEDWKGFRKGMFTASEIHRLLAKPKTGELSVGAETYIQERIAVMLAPQKEDFYNSAMEHGNETEPQAIMAIAEKHGFNVTDEDFIYTSIGGFVFFTDDDEVFGCTPDLITPVWISEIKCPDSATHLKYMLMKTAQDILDNCKDYYTQMQVNMYLTGKNLCKFVSFDDRYYNAKHIYHEIDVPFDEVFMNDVLSKINRAEIRKQQILLQINER